MYHRRTLQCTPNERTQVASASTSFDVREDSHYVVALVGVYGFAGLGKTTLCKCLCDFYFAEFNGKVCHIDLGLEPSKQASSQKYCSNGFFLRMKHVMAMLTYHIFDDQPLQFSQVQNLLRGQVSSMTDPVFLAIDNILPEWDSLREAEFYLSLKFPKGSKIFLTARSFDILENLTSQLKNFLVEIDHIPGLEFQEARDIFMHEIPKVRDPRILNDEGEVNNLVNMCIIPFHKDFGEHQWAWSEYHPLMLKSLATSIKWKRTRHLDWNERLARSQSDGIVGKTNALEMVFKLLDISYESLSEETKTLFLDLALFYSATQNTHAIQDWVEKVYSHLQKDEIEHIFSQLHDLFFIRGRPQIPDLLVDFAKYKALQDKRRGIGPQYLVVDGEFCPEIIFGHVRHVCISRCEKARRLDLRSVERLEVLHLVDNAVLQQVLLSRTSCACLRSVIVRVPPGMSLHLIMDEDLSVSAAGRERSGAWAVGPWWTQFEGDVVLTAAPVLELGSLGNPLNLESLTLFGLSVQGIDVTMCANLKNLEISDCKELMTLTIPNNSLSSAVSNCRSLERVSLCTTSSYPEVGCSNNGSLYVDPSPILGWNSGGSLCINSCPTFSEIDGLAQYSGKVMCYGEVDDANLEETFGDLLKSAGIDSSICKARVSSLQFSGSSLGLAGVEMIHVKDAQHIGLLITALFKAKPACLLSDLVIFCKKGGDCGCDESVPSFGPVRVRLFPSLTYCCPQVRDLASIAQWDVLKELTLSGCTSLEVWPDFATMTSLQLLDLSYTSLKEWPAGVRLLRRLKWLDVRGCRQLPAEELIKEVALEQDIKVSKCGRFVLGTIIDDLRARIRDRCSIMDALDSQLLEFWQGEGLDSWQCNIEILVFIISLLYDFWFDEGLEAAGDYCEGSPSVVGVQKMERLLCSAFFMSLPFHLWSRAEGGFNDTYMAFVLMGIAVVGTASIGCYNAGINEGLKDSITSFLKSFSQDEYGGGKGISSTMLQQDHLYLLVHWSLGPPRYLDLFRQLSSCPHLLGTRVPKLRERFVEGVWKIARAAELGPDFIQGLEATLLSRNFLRYDVMWLLRAYIDECGEYRLDDDVLRVYYKLLGKTAFQSVAPPGVPS